MDGNISIEKNVFTTQRIISCEDFGKRIVFAHELYFKSIGQHEKKSYNYISKYLDTRHIAGGVHPWPSSKNSAWRKEIYAEAWTTKKGGNISIK